MTNIEIQVGSWAIDHEWLLATLHGSYWGGHYTRSLLEKAIEQSLCFSAMFREPGDLSWTQVGFARVLTDGAITSMLNDVIVDEKWRGQGIGTALLKKVFAHPDVARTICVIQSRPENWQRYAKFGFVPVSGMFKRDPQ